MNQCHAAAVNPKPAQVRIAGHFGELAQGLAGPEGPVALITLPCPVLVTQVSYLPRRGELGSAEPVSRKARCAAAATLARLGKPEWGGELVIRRACPPGLGAGTSTAEALGAVRAVAMAFGTRFAPDDEAALCLAAEGAVDPLMHEGTILFASRRGRILRHLSPIPRIAVIGGFAGYGRTTDPADNAFPPMQDVFASIASALRTGDVMALGEACSQSARANQTRNPNMAWEAVQDVAKDVGAAGICVAHTGSAIALLFTPKTDLASIEPLLLSAGLQEIVSWHL